MNTLGYAATYSDGSGTHSDHDVGLLMTRLMKDRAVDFRALNTSLFERLVGDILSREDYTLTASSHQRDMGHDFVGSQGGERWVVEVKHYHPHSRVSVSAIHQVMVTLRHFEPDANALFVTSAQLTSVAQEYLENAFRDSSARIRVIDGVALKQLLAKYPDLIDKYFAAGQLGRG